MSDLKQQAEELGLKIDGRWSDERIQQEIDAKLAADPLDHDNDGKKGGAKTLPDTLDVYLDYDTWVPDSSDPDGYRRIVADHDKPQPLPFDRAKELLKAGKARRADPLPGE
jgi:hypothetical protein